MYFKFLENETILFNKKIIKNCEIYFERYIESYFNNDFPNRQCNLPGIGTYYITEFEVDAQDNNAVYGTINFVYETIETSKLIFRFKNYKIMSITITQI